MADNTLSLYLGGSRCSIVGTHEATQSDPLGKPPFLYIADGYKRVKIELTDETLAMLKTVVCQLVADTDRKQVFTQSYERSAYYEDYKQKDLGKVREALSLLTERAYGRESY